LSIWTLNNPEFAGVVLYGMDMRLAWVSMTFFVGCVAAAILLRGYNGDRGRRMRWTFYVIYPVHLAVIGLTALALGLVTLAQFGINI